MYWLCKANNTFERDSSVFSCIPSMNNTDIYIPTLNHQCTFYSTYIYFEKKMWPTFICQLLLHYMRVTPIIRCLHLNQLSLLILSILTEHNSTTEYNSSRKHLSYNLQLTNSVIGVYGRWLTRHMANHQAPWLHRQHGHRSHERRWDTGHMSTGYKHLPAASPRSAYDNRCTSVNTEQSKPSTRNTDWQQPAGSKKRTRLALCSISFFLFFF